MPDEKTVAPETTDVTPENPATAAVDAEAVETIKAEEAIADKPAPVPPHNDNKPDKIDEAEAVAPKKDDEKPSAESAAPATAAPAVKRERRTPRQVMRVRGARGTNTRLPPARRREQYVDAEMPVVRSERRFATNDFSYPYFKVSVYLYSDAAQKFFERHFQRIDRDMQLVSLIVGIIGNEKVAESQMERMNTKCQEMQKGLLDAIGELKRGMNSRSIPEEMQVPAYDHKRLYTPALHSPLARVFLDIVQTFDRLNARVDGAWFNGLITQENRRQMVGAWMRQLARFAGTISDIRTEAIAEAKKVGKQQDAKQITTRVEADKSNDTIQGRDVADDKGAGN